ncbi:MAG: bifunctional glutamine synthetase adenylyltransferase/deadenyltransferase, partial [Sedimenticolaceae bacterium]
RQKMRDSLDRSDATHFHIKQGAGGLVDIEFLVQFAVLRWAHDYPDLTAWTDNARLLESLKGLSLLPKETTEQLWDAYQKYRGVVHRNALQEAGSLVPHEELAAERAMVSAIWQDIIGAA